MKSTYNKQIILLILLMIVLFIASTGGINDFRLSNFLAGVSISVVAAVFSFIFLKDRDTTNKIDPEELKKMFIDTFGSLNNADYNRVDRNMAMGEKYWLDLIEDMDVIEDTVWFVGTRLSWWLKTSTYRGPLMKKFNGRLTEAAKKYDESNSNNKYITYIILENNNALSDWNNFTSDIINNVIRSKLSNINKEKDLSNYLRSKIIILNIPKELSRYSLVLCNDRLAVTVYTSVGRSEDSPTIDIKPNSVIRQLYIDDLEKLVIKLKSGIEYPKPQNFDS